MHYLYYVAIKKDEEEKTSQELKEEATEVLDSNGFASEGGFFSSSKADWYVIGGRWSGHLSVQKLKGNYFKEVKEKFLDNKDYYSNEDVKKHAKEIQALWIEMGGTGENPYDRDQYRHTGADDDAMLLDRKLFDGMKRKTHPDTEVLEVVDGSIENETSLDEFLKDDSIINNFYLVVIDYHN